MKDIVIVGSGGFAKEVAFLIEEINHRRLQWNLLGFIDKGVGEKKGKYLIYQDDEWLINHDQPIDVVFGIGNPSLVKKIAQGLSVKPNIKFPNLIHPNVTGDFDSIVLGKGNIICAGNIFTTDIKIGSFNIFNLSCTVGHDVSIGNFNVFNPTVNISGGVKTGDTVLVGTGSQILQYVEIKSNITVGAGAVVTKNLIEEGVYVGIPARKMG